MPVVCLRNLGFPRGQGSKGWPGRCDVHEVCPKSEGPVPGGELKCLLSASSLAGALHSAELRKLSKGVGRHTDYQLHILIPQASPPPDRLRGGVASPSQRQPPWVTASRPRKHIPPSLERNGACSSHILPLACHWKWHQSAYTVYLASEQVSSSCLAAGWLAPFWFDHLPGGRDLSLWKEPACMPPCARCPATRTLRVGAGV